MHALTKLAEFVANHPEGALTPETRAAIELLLLDLMGATAAGLHSQLATAARQAAIEAYGPGKAQVWLTGTQLSVTGAAMANSAAASALDIDDGHRGAAGHAGAGVIPAALAVGQAINAADNDILDAIALGYDVALRIASSRPTSTIESYSSGRWVSYGAAAACGRLLKLDAEKMAHALAIAGSEGPIIFPSGASKFQGSTVKEGIPPAVVAGITGAYRAKAGATGPIDLLDNEQRYDPTILFAQLGQVWELQKCYLKPYACCRYMHAAIDAILKLRRDGKPIRKLRIETFPQALRLANERKPKTLEGGQYSFYFSCALAALRPLRHQRLRPPRQRPPHPSQPPRRPRRRPDPRPRPPAAIRWVIWHVPVQRQHLLRRQLRARPIRSTTSCRRACSAARAMPTRSAPSWRCWVGKRA